MSGREDAAAFFDGNVQGRPSPKNDFKTRPCISNFTPSRSRSFFWRFSSPSEAKSAILPSFLTTLCHGTEGSQVCRAPSDLSGHPGVTGQKGYLTVADNLTGRNGTDNVIDSFKEIHQKVLYGLSFSSSGRNRSFDKTAKLITSFFVLSSFLEYPSALPVLWMRSQPRRGNRRRNWRYLSADIGRLPCRGKNFRRGGVALC